MDTTHDFQDGNGPVPAHHHSNGGGWVADTAHVDQEILARIKSGGGLEMGTWHTCETTHCLAGWAQVCRGLPETAAAYEAGVRLIPALAPWFFSTNDLAMEKLLELAGEVNEVKAFFSTRVDKFRPPYGAPQGGSK